MLGGVSTVLILGQFDECACFDEGIVILAFDRESGNFCR